MSKQITKSSPKSSDFTFDYAPNTRHVYGDTLANVTQHVRDDIKNNIVAIQENKGRVYDEYELAYQTNRIHSWSIMGAAATGLFTAASIIIQLPIAAPLLIASAVTSGTLMGVANRTKENKM